MLWVDCETFFGPDRRRAKARFRLRERRRLNLADHPPSLNASLRQLHVRAFAAGEPGALPSFLSRASAVAQLADINGEHKASHILMGMARQFGDTTAPELRDRLAATIDRARSALRAA